MAIFVGSTVRVRCEFTDSAGAYYDPDTVTLKIKLPDTTTQTYTWAGGGVKREAAGKFYRDVLTVTGTYTVDWEGPKANDATAITEGTFTVEARAV